MDPEPGVEAARPRRSEWRVERARLELFIEQAHAETGRFITEHPFNGQPDDEAE